MTEEKPVKLWIGDIEWSEGIIWECPFCDNGYEIFASDGCLKCGAVVKTTAVKS